MRQVEGQTYNAEEPSKDRDRSTPADFRKATQRIYRAPGRASFVDLPVVESR